ncbi:MAG TPA: hypothetical protein VFF52_27910 [Isosphaeraceae bacterium]|nr:hypothetical protein [Isosphaeraceae bacterium]
MADPASESAGDDPPQLECRRCGRALQPGRGDLHVVSILALADPYPPVFTEDDLALDVGSEIRNLIAHLSGLDAREAQDQVYRRQVFPLCGACYHDWIDDPTGSGF